VNVLVVRAAAFVVGSAIAGCVYATHAVAPASTGKPASILAAYPGARETSGNPGGDAAAVDVRLPMVELHFNAVRDGAAASPAKVVASYRKVLARSRRVTVVRGAPSSRMGTDRSSPSSASTRIPLLERIDSGCLPGYTCPKPLGQ